MRSAFLILLAIAAPPNPARAQPAGDKAAADALFAEGKAFMGKGQLAEACAKFQASVDALPQLGVRLNLADCYDKRGQVASAWAEFRQAASLAAKTGDPREEFARQRAEALAPRLPRLVIKAATVPGLAIKRDGLAVPLGLLDTAVPVDPGEHTVEASAPGHEDWSGTATAAEGQTSTVEVPALVAVVTPSEEELPLEAPVDAGPPRGRGRRLAGLAVGAGGVVGLGVGAVFGLSARSKWTDAKDGHCDADVVCDQEGFALVEDARSAGSIATIASIAGGVALAAGLVIYLTAPDGPEPAATVGLVPTGSGLAVRGSF